ncbi:Mechanosensory protein [Dirofilaria immitis]
MSTIKHEIISSKNSAANSIDNNHLNDEKTESLASFSIKDDLSLSDNSDKAENSAMEVHDNLIEQLPENLSIIEKRNRISITDDLKFDQSNIIVVKNDTNIHQQANIQGELGFCGWILTILSYILIFFTLPISVCMCVKVVQEYERVVIFRLGRLMPGGAKGPGIFFIVPCIDTYRKVDLRVISFEVPPQEILSKDSVTVAVDAVVYFRISNATVSVTNVEDAARSTKLLAQTTLRNILGTKTLTEMLSDREAISLQMQITLDEATEPWGVKVERVEVKDVRLPVQLQRAMAAEAEAAREARAKVIVAEGEQKASRALKEAAEIIAESPSALQLRYLQTLNSISAEKNSTIIFPFPIDLLSSFFNRSTSKVVTKAHSS